MALLAHTGEQPTHGNNALAISVPRRTKWPLRGGIVEPTVNVTASFHISPPRASPALYAPAL